ncbi:MAG: DNA topoisomerase (ATP-hydrolyzing), partial [Nanoarchaeota archaeon]
MTEQIQTRLIEEEMKSSYIDYAMSVITARALPDARDGLKPVHRRVLYAMLELGLLNNKQTKKSARIVGETLGKFHPHGDIAVYDALARMAQDFSLRYPLVIGQGNWGSIDGDPPAAMRYTEAKLSRLAEELLDDIDKETVDFVPNFDNSLKEPIVLPSKVPNLLINGSSGIAVGMATNIPPHNINEIIDAVNIVIDNKNIEINELLNVVKGPDFPTGGIISGKQGIIEAYKTGRGKIIVKAKTKIEQRKIIVEEIPYQVNKTFLIEGIVELVKEKRIEGISDIRDESDRKGMRLVIELKSNANPEVVLNQLYQHTQLQNTFGIIMLALDENKPKILNLKELINAFIQHRFNVVTRRSKFELNKAEKRAHLLEGLKIALKDIDNVIKLIKQSKNAEQARQELINNYNLTYEQSIAILDLKLQRLTSLEQENIHDEHKSLLNVIKDLKEILADENKIYQIIKQELIGLKQKYNDERKTIIEENGGYLMQQDLVQANDVVVTMTYSGYIKQ